MIDCYQEDRRGDGVKGMREGLGSKILCSITLNTPGPIMMVGASTVFGNDMVPFLIHTGTRKYLFKGSKEANHVEQRPLLGLTSLVL